MRRLLALAILLLVALVEPAAAQEARIVSRTEVAPRTVDLQVASPALGTTAGVRLLLPARFAERPRKRWPVLLLLHGCCTAESFRAWTERTDVEGLTARDDVLVVMPEGGQYGFYTNWLRGPQWQRFHLRELRRLLEREFRASRRRAVAGLSMGGHGAMRYAARRPRLFRAAASFSGVVATRVPEAFPAALLGALAAAGEDPLALWGDPVARRRVWDRHDPLRLAHRLRGTRLYVSSGDGRPGPLDPPGTGVDALEVALGAQAQAFVARLRKLGIPVTANLYGPGTHTWPYWERELAAALPGLLRAIGARRAGTGS
jgi:S-formylglutathione hydrolase FrmB